MKYIVNIILFVVLWVLMFLPVMKFSIDTGATSLLAIGGVIAIIISYSLVKKINKSNLWASLFDETEDEKKVEKASDVVMEKKVEVVEEKTKYKKNTIIKFIFAVFLSFISSVFFSYDNKENQLIFNHYLNLNQKVENEKIVKDLFIEHLKYEFDWLYNLNQNVGYIFDVNKKNKTVVFTFSKEVNNKQGSYALSFKNKSVNEIENDLNEMRKNAIVDYLSQISLYDIKSLYDFQTTDNCSVKNKAFAYGVIREELGIPSYPQKFWEEFYERNFKIGKQQKYENSCELVIRKLDKQFSNNGSHYIFPNKWKYESTEHIVADFRSQFLTSFFLLTLLFFIILIVFSKSGISKNKDLSKVRKRINTRKNKIQKNKLTSDNIDELDYNLKKLYNLKKKGILTDEEFNEQKKKLLEQ